MNARVINVMKSGEPTPNMVTLGSEHAYVIERFEQVCDTLLDHYDYTVASLFQNMTLSLFNDRNTIYNGEFGLGVQRISEEFGEDTNFLYERLNIVVSLNLNEFGHNPQKGGYINVTTYIENYFEGGVERVTRHVIPLYDLYGHGNADINKVVKKINAIYAREVLKLEEEDSSVNAVEYINQSDFDRHLLKKMALDKAQGEYIDAEIDSVEEGTPYLTWAIARIDEEGREIGTPHIRMVNRLNNIGNNDIYISVSEYFEELLSNVLSEE